MNRTTLITAVATAAVILTVLVAVSPFNSSAAGVVRISGDTSPGVNQVGWLFNSDPSVGTSHVFTPDTASIGIGSLYVGPISDSDPDERFVARYFPETLPVTDFDSFSYDFKIGPSGNSGDADQFSVSIFANIDDSDNDYDCRYDYVENAATQASFSKSVLFPSAAPSAIEKNGSRISECPPILSSMPAGSHIREISLNTGNDTLSDAGVDGFYDNVEIVVNGDGTTFNFEPLPQSKEDCQKDKWKSYNFKNQGQCLQSINKK